jgi:hypothetical protein
MIKIVGAEPVRNRILRLEFSDGSSGDYDLAPLIARGTSLTSMLADDADRRGPGRDGGSRARQINRHDLLVESGERIPTPPPRVEKNSARAFRVAVEPAASPTG